MILNGAAIWLLASIALISPLIVRAVLQERADRKRRAVADAIQQDKAQVIQFPSTKKDIP